MTKSYMRGHEIYYVEDTQTWKYSDNDDIADYERPCKRCGRLPTPEGYDACLRHIEGVISACCGHGVDEPFVMYNNTANQIN